jgi:iron complex outermembrane receptor protein
MAGPRRKGILLLLALGQALASPGIVRAQPPATTAPSPPPASTGALKKMSVEELLELEVTSVSKRPEKLAEAPSAIQVITHEDIRRSGATTLPEALRLAANLNVARIDPAQYAISARGFNNAVGNKLLVLIDGRTVYTPLFSGVFWEQQDVMLEDVERIEVISGPGAVLWGANAVNGVINVITWSARDTQGVLVAAGGGPDERGAALRYGGAFRGGESGHFRVYAKAIELDHLENAAGTALPNGWERVQGGFRIDRPAAGGELALQGDVYDGSSDHRGFVAGFDISPVEVSGANLLGRWIRARENGSELRVQAYFDHARRDDIVFFRPTSDIFDLEFQHGSVHGRHTLLWGGGYRHARDDVDPGLLFAFDPQKSALDFVNLFARDQIALTESLELAAGLKLEHNDYTGIEPMPSARLAWRPSSEHLLWIAATRAVRTPSRLDRDILFPASPPFLVRGGPDFSSETANIFQLGYRAQRLPDLTWSATLFHHEWDRLRSGQTAPGFLENRIEGSVYGAELWASWQVVRGWKLSAGGTALEKDLALEPGSTDPVGTDNPSLANDPEYTWTLRSSWSFGSAHDFDIFFQAVDELPNPRVPSYTTLNARYAWRVTPRLELSVTGANLLESSHVEFNDPATAVEIDRIVYGKLLWQY